MNVRMMMNFNVPRHRYELLDIMIKHLCIASNLMTHYVPS